MMKKTLFTLSLVLAFSGLVSVSAQEKSDPITAGEFTFTYGEPWVRQAVTSPMRKGQLTYKQSDENLTNVDAVFFHFGPGGGSVQANIDRWAGQFAGQAETKTEKKTINGREIVFFSGTGTFRDSVGGPFSGQTVDKEDYSMLAAILPSEGGMVFLKMTGPKDSVAAAKDAFFKVAESGLQK